MTGQIDLDQLLDPVRGDIEDREVMSDTSIVYQDGRSAELLSHLQRGCVDRFGVGYVALDVLRSHCTSVPDKLLHIFGS